MTQEEFAGVVVRFSGLCLVWHGGINVVKWIGARFIVEAAQGAGADGDAATTAVNQIIKSLHLTDLVLNVAAVAVGLYCVFNGKAIMRLLCRREGVGRTA